MGAGSAATTGDALVEVATACDRPPAGLAECRNLLSSRIAPRYRPGNSAVTYGYQAVCVGDAVQMSPARTVVEALHDRATYHADAISHSFVRDIAVSNTCLTYGELYRAAELLAARLLERVRPQDRVTLVLQPGLDYIVALMACFRARIIAVPAFPPRARRLSGMLAGLCRDCDAALLVTDARSLAAVEEQARTEPALAAVPRLVLGATGMTEGTAYAGPQPDAADLAVLQYTSGSTGRPKGVMVTHGNLVANLQQQCERFGVCETSRLVTWLPPYHDMGLVAGILQSPYSGCRTTVLSPLYAMQRPVRWLQAIQDMRATISGGPPFGYDMCVETVTDAECAALDLSSWECAFVGAEPISSEVLDRFAARFQAAGLRAGVFAPCYGLAEATLMVAGRAAGSGVVAGAPVGDDAAPRPSSGAAVHDHDVRVVDPEMRILCSEGVEGEIWVRGPSVAAGYWNDAAGTMDTFAGELRDGGPPWLRTGDLGVLIAGELTVTGRIKDLIIFAGRKLHPEDIETTLRGIADDRLRPGAVAAFAAEVRGRERVVVAVELRRRVSNDAELSPLRAAIAAAVTRGHEVPLHDVLFLGPGELPRTSSGKIRRHRCAQDYLAAINAPQPEFAA